MAEDVEEGGAGKKHKKTESITQDTGHRRQDTGHRIQDTGYRKQDTGYRVLVKPTTAGKKKFPPQAMRTLPWWGGPSCSLVHYSR